MSAVGIALDRVGSPPGGSGGGSERLQRESSLDCYAPSWPLLASLRAGSDVSAPRPPGRLTLDGCQPRLEFKSHRVSMGGP